MVDIDDIKKRDAGKKLSYPLNTEEDIRRTLAAVLEVIVELSARLTAVENKKS